MVARWNAVITERLLDAALDALLRSGAQRADIEVVRVPGAWEIPRPHAPWLILPRQQEGGCDYYAGCLLRGETAHYEAIYNEVARGIGQSQQETGDPAQLWRADLRDAGAGTESRRHQSGQQGI